MVEEWEIFRKRDLESVCACEQSRKLLLSVWSSCRCACEGVALNGPGCQMPAWIYECLYQYAFEVKHPCMSPVLNSRSFTSWEFASFSKHSLHESYDIWKTLVFSIPRFFACVSFAHTNSCMYYFYLSYVSFPKVTKQTSDNQLTQYLFSVENIWQGIWREVRCCR